jgi:hypothetical protein
LPPERFEREYAADAARLGANPVFRMVTPSIARLRWAEAYRQTERALLRAAVRVQRHGVAALNTCPDPYDGRPFDYVPRRGGFRLQSRLERAGKPLGLTAGPLIEV